MCAWGEASYMCAWAEASYMCAWAEASYMCARVAAAATGIANISIAALWPSNVPLFRPPTFFLNGALPIRTGVPYDGTERGVVCWLLLLL